MKLLDRPAAGTRSRAEEIGEIAIKGHNIMKGYYNRPEATDEAIQDGWFRSGDLGQATRTAGTTSSTGPRT